MSWCYTNRGKDYHWIVELFKALNLPVLSAVVRALKKAVDERIKNLLKKQTDEAKRQRVSQKVAKKKTRRRKKTIQHSYGLTMMMSKMLK